jgi:hypothetical protein
MFFSHLGTVISAIGHSTHGYGIHIHPKKDLGHSTYSTKMSVIHISVYRSYKSRLNVPVESTVVAE